MTYRLLGLIGCFVFSFFGWLLLLQIVFSVS